MLRKRQKTKVKRSQAGTSRWHCAHSLAHLFEEPELVFASLFPYVVGEPGRHVAPVLLRFLHTRFLLADKIRSRDNVGPFQLRLRAHSTHRAARTTWAEARSISTQDPALVWRRLRFVSVTWAYGSTDQKPTGRVPLEPIITFFYPPDIVGTFGWLWIVFGTSLFGKTYPCLGSKAGNRKWSGHSTD